MTIQKRLTALLSLLAAVLVSACADGGESARLLPTEAAYATSGSKLKRLVGEEIPFNARVVGIVDVYDALTSPRSFRQAYSRDEALQIMQRDAVKMFDPNLFGIFTDMMKRGGFD